MKIATGDHDGNIAVWSIEKYLKNNHEEGLRIQNRTSVTQNHDIDHSNGDQLHAVNEEP